MPLPLLIPAISAGISAIPSIFQAGVAARQMREGRETLRNLKRPEYETPSGFMSAMALSRQAAADPYMPGEAEMRNRAAQAGSNAFANAREAGNPLAVVGQIQANQARAMQNIGIASAEQQIREERNLQDMFGVYAKYQDQEWQMNKFAPYSMQYNEAREQVGAGQQNLFSALDRLSAVGSTFLSSYVGGNGITAGRGQAAAAALQSGTETGNPVIQSAANVMTQGFKNAASNPNMDFLKGMNPDQINQILRLMMKNAG